MSSSWGFSFGGVRLWLSSALQLVAKVLVEHGIKQRVWTALIRKGAEPAEVTCVFGFDGEEALQLKHTRRPDSSDNLNKLHSASNMNVFTVRRSHWFRDMESIANHLFHYLHMTEGF